MDLSRYHQFNDQYASLPLHIQHALSYYVTEGQQVGHFLSAVIANDLQETFAHADLENVRELKNIVQWLFNVAPRSCWGSEAKLDAWCAQGGLKGLPCPA